MPRYYNNRRRRRRGRRVQRGSATTPWYNKKYSVSEVANAAWRGVQYIKTLVNSEVHKLSVTATGATLSTTPGVVHITQIAQGDLVSNRTGNQVLLSYLSIRCRVNSHASSVATTGRFAIVLDKQQVADTDVSWDSVFESVSPLSHYDVTQAGRYKILLDKVFQFDNLSKRAFHYKKTLTINKHIRFNGTASSDIQKNGIYMVYMSGEATNTATMDYDIRIGWHDN